MVWVLNEVFQKKGDRETVGEGIFVHTRLLHLAYGSERENPGFETGQYHSVGPL